MKITNVRVVNVSVPFAVFGAYRPMTMWYGTRYSTNHTIIFIDTDEGITGVGETWDRNAYEVESIKPKLIGLDPLEIEKITSMSIDRSRSIFYARALHNVSPTVISAIDCALWDIMGKVTNQPLYKLLGGKVNDTIHVRYWMCEKPPEEQSLEALKALERGWKAFKIKIGADPKKDIQTVKMVREIVGDKIELGFDINGSYSLPTAIRTLKKMEKYNPSHIEEPINAQNFRGYIELKKHIDIPIEFHYNGPLKLTDVLTLVNTGAMDLLHLNLMQNGGIIYCNKLCAIAEAAGIPVTGQSSAAELGPGNAFNLHWITSNVSFSGTNDSSTHLLEPPASDIIKDEFKTENGCLKVPEGPGLGIKIDEKKLEKYNKIWLSKKYPVDSGIPRSNTYYW